MFDGPTYFTASATRLVQIPGPPPFNQSRHVPVRQGSVLDRLGKVATRLAHSFLWSEAAGAWFVLTGKPPAGMAAYAMVRFSSVGARAKVTLEVPAFTMPAAVARLYATMRRRAGRSARWKPSQRRVRLLVFMLEQGAEHVSPGLYRKYAETVQADDRYPGKSGWRNAARDFRDDMARLRSQ
jgi:hypothetical protein